MKNIGKTNQYINNSLVGFPPVFDSFLQRRYIAYLMREEMLMLFFGTIKNLTVSGRENSPTLKVVQAVALCFPWWQSVQISGADLKAW